MKRLTEEEVKNILNRYGYNLIGNYTNSFSKTTTIECPNKHISTVRFNNFVARSSRCSICDKQKVAKRCKKSYDILVSSFNSGTILTPKEEYEKNHHKKGKLKIQCKCGSIREVTSNALLKYPNCVKCKLGSEKKKKKIDEIERLVTDKGYKLKQNFYVNSKVKMELECEKHGNFSIRFNDLQQRHGCPTCGNIESLLEKEVMDFILSIYSGKILKRYRKILNGQELDIFLPEKGLAIEMDGLYWHSELKKKDAKKLNMKKISKCQHNNIKLLAFFEDEWKNKQEIVKSIIKSNLNLNDKIYARKTELKIIKNKQAKKFLNENHIDGYVKSTKSIGLFFQNELVMCLCVRTSVGGLQEISRMASKMGVTVVGGASKLISSIDGDLITYSNNRISNGNVYQKIGFKECTVTKDPSYYYTDFKIRVWRFKCKKIKHLEGTEREQAERGEFHKYFGHKKPVYRIYDYGHRKWIKRDNTQS